MIPHSGHLKAPSELDASNRRMAGRILAERVKTSLGQILDFSSTGMRMYSPFLAPSTSKFHTMIVHGPDGDFVIAGRIMWVKKIGIFAREFGLEFYGLDDQAREGIATLARFTMQVEGCEHRRAA